MCQSEMSNHRPDMLSQHASTKPDKLSQHAKQKSLYKKGYKSPEQQTSSGQVGIAETEEKLWESEESEYKKISKANTTKLQGARQGKGQLKDQ